MVTARVGKGGRLVPNNFAVDSAGNTVLQLEVHLGDGVVGEDGGIRDIACMSKSVSVLDANFRVHIISVQHYDVWMRASPAVRFPPPHFASSKASEPDNISPAENHASIPLPVVHLVDSKGSNVRIAADSTMLRIVNLLIALSLGVHRAQLEQRTGLTWPRPFLLRPLFKKGTKSAIQNQKSRSKVLHLLSRSPILASFP